jgi:hypothetical protein
MLTVCAVAAKAIAIEAYDKYRSSVPQRHKFMKDGFDEALRKINGRWGTWPLSIVSNRSSVRL